MPGRSGVEVCAAIKEISPTTGIIMLTASDDESDLYESIRSGASGYLLKDGSTYEQVAEAVRLVSSGQSLISPSMATELPRRVRAHVQEPGADDQPDSARARGAAARGPRSEQP
ncbi:response regulator transcription factor [Aeromicrobium sp. UC242_57]|uniref:response regulator transcription factor n=1 Tax=Aeromicrobium sp. UC242_57 TaxID=3374624 RepID=UPI0037888C33